MQDAPRAVILGAQFGDNPRKEAAKVAEGDGVFLLVCDVEDQRSGGSGALHQTAAQAMLIFPSSLR
jgi:hypothetical protein